MPKGHLYSTQSIEEAVALVHDEVLVCLKPCLTDSVLLQHRTVLTNGYKDR